MQSGGGLGGDAVRQGVRLIGLAAVTGRQQLDPAGELGGTSSTAMPFSASRTVSGASRLRAPSMTDPSQEIERLIAFYAHVVDERWYSRLPKILQRGRHL